MLLKFAADGVVLLHFVFIIFVVLGGVVAVRQPRLIWFHLPAVIWGAFIEFSGGICPLTPLENRLRIAAGEAGYPGGFIERYLIPVVYPDGLTRWIQISLGVGVVVINLVVYGLMVARRLRMEETGNGAGL
ncbi:MAG: DUF2784 domain-containing protein [Acidobacteria bacterium]|nr:MAG: DUF2784 domain-containing protein [Acidobacteriota bacterium]